MRKKYHELIKKENNTSTENIGNKGITGNLENMEIMEE